MKTITPRESQKDLIKKVNDNFTESAANQAALVSADATLNESLALKAAKPVQVASLVLVAANWALVSGLYEYSLSNANILATSIVDVIPNNADYNTVKAAELLPRTDSSAGSVKLYSKNLPGGNIGVTINIF